MRKEGEKCEMQKWSRKVSQRIGARKGTAEGNEVMMEIEKHTCLCLYFERCFSNKIRLKKRRKEEEQWEIGFDFYYYWHFDYLSTNKIMNEEPLFCNEVWGCYFMFHSLLFYFICFILQFHNFSFILPLIFIFYLGNTKGLWTTTSNNENRYFFLPLSCLFVVLWGCIWNGYEMKRKGKEKSGIFIPIQ